MRKPIALHRMKEMRAAGEKIAKLTCDDATLAAVLDDAGVDILLVGKSLGMAPQGRTSTKPVSLGDLPDGSCHERAAQAFASAAALMQAGAHMVKLRISQAHDRPFR